MILPIAGPLLILISTQKLSESIFIISASRPTCIPFTTITLPPTFVSCWIISSRADIFRFSDLRLLDLDIIDIRSEPAVLKTFLIGATADNFSSSSLISSFVLPSSDSLIHSKIFNIKHDLFKLSKPILKGESLVMITDNITSRNNAPISNYGGGFRCKSEYPWCIMEFKFLRNLSKTRKFAILKIWYKVLHKFFFKYLVDKIFLALSKYLLTNHFRSESKEVYVRSNIIFCFSYLSLLLVQKTDVVHLAVGRIELKINRHPSDVNISWHK
ncbi:hypothetical protein AGLY_000979 [Aphis glycines]|uniref:Uncharacterized protein n=1 Tax=Aphis glycines TaxID=307491 RepID=A0A6G0UB11_APHGL|nr:hypothetical protein AGLY_000979 [Aphis glycines]